MNKKAIEIFVHQLRFPFLSEHYVPEEELCLRAAELIIELQGDIEVLENKLEKRKRVVIIKDYSKEKI